MDVSITDLVEELKFNTRMQETEKPYTDEDYLNNVKHGIKLWFIYTQKASVYDKRAYYIQDEEMFYPYELDATATEFVLLQAMLDFYKQVSASYMGLMNYTTDALSVQHADKPYENAKHCMIAIEDKLRTVYFKDVDNTLPLLED